MTSDLDPNRIAVDFLTEHAERAYELGASKFRSASNAVKAAFNSTYKSYVLRLLQRYSTAKSFFLRTDPVPIYDFYVPLDLTTQRRTLRKPSAAEVAAVSPFAILTATGGSGKSMLMRHFLVSALVNRSKTPIFVELRHFNQRNDTLEEALLASLRANGLDVDTDYFIRALKAGHFLILLDGYDELEKQHRQHVAKSAQDLAERYPSNWIFLSSRPDRSLEGWNAFAVLRVAPLDLTRAVELVDKVAFDDAIKSRFIGDLEDGLFDRHSSFLSNPLLLSIMLLTYRDTANIPSKLSVFYNQAYESLFQKHDALKSGYLRPHGTTLDIQDFARVFAAFCVLSFSKREFAFSRTRALELLAKASIATHLSYETADYLDDALQAVCLLVEDGLDITFSHRSFQEYFSAIFVSTSPPAIKAQLIKRFAKSAPSDQVISLLYEIDPIPVENYYILPALQRFRNAIGYKGRITKAVHLKALQFLYTDYHIMDNEEETLGSVIRDRDLTFAIDFAYDNYCPPIVYDPGNNFEALFVELYGAEKQLSTSQLKVSDRFVKTLAASKGIWGTSWLQTALSIEETISTRQAASVATLDEILGV